MSRRITDVELLVERHAGRYSAARLMWASIFIGSLAFGVLAGVAAVRLGSPPSRLAAAEESAQVFMLDNQTEEHIQGWYEMQKQSGPVRRKKGE